MLLGGLGLDARFSFEEFDVKQDGATAHLTIFDELLTCPLRGVDEEDRRGATMRAFDFLGLLHRKDSSSGEHA